MRVRVIKQQRSVIERISRGRNGLHLMQVSTRSQCVPPPGISTTSTNVPLTKHLAFEMKDKMLETDSQSNREYVEHGACRNEAISVCQYPPVATARTQIGDLNGIELPRIEGSPIALLTFLGPNLYTAPRCLVTKQCVQLPVASAQRHRSRSSF